MNKLFILLVFYVGINATAQVATSGTNNSGTNASAIGYQSSATNTVSTAIGRETLASGVTSTAMGYQTSATNTASTAMGNGTFEGDVKEIRNQLIEYCELDTYAMVKILEKLCQV